MNNEERLSFEAADKKVHPVETQWHYPIMLRNGFDAVTQEGIGFVRSYVYVNPRSMRSIVCTTGSSSDYWTDAKTKKMGYWRDLEPYLVKLNGEQA